MSKRPLHSYRVDVIESIRYTISVDARSDDHAKEIAQDLWHEQMQLFRCTGDSSIDGIFARKIGGDQ